MELTQEQKDILKAFKENSKIKINAYAGTGKTTTLKAITEDNPEKKFLIITFNKAISDELKTKMPKNCQIYTIHSLAYKFLPNEYKNKLTNNTKIMVDEIIKLMEVDSIKANLYVKVFEAFCNSDYLKINSESIKKIIFGNRELKNYLYFTNNQKQTTQQYIEQITDAIEYIFFAIKRQQLPITHSYYLKLFQQNLDKYNDFFKKFDAILVDEGQDLNGIQEYILKNAPVKKKVIVGDKHQSIYSWRGSINTLARLKEWKEYPLTTTFRIQNKEIIEYTNKFLKNWKRDNHEIKSKNTQKINQTLAYITRTNSKIVELIASAKEPVRFSRNIDDIFKVVREAQKIIYYFNTGNEKHLTGMPIYIKEMLKRLRNKTRSIEELSVELSALGEFEYSRAIHVALKYDIEALYQKALKLNSPNSNIMFTTAHSSKGLEFREIYLTEDFLPLLDYIIEFIKVEIKEDLRKLKEEEVKKLVDGIVNHVEEYSEIIDEMNLQYVAITRAIENAKGYGYQIIKNNFNTVLNEKTIMEEVKKEIKKKRLEEMPEFLSNTGIDWKKLL